MPKPKLNDLLAQSITREQSAQKPPATRPNISTKVDQNSLLLQWIDEDRIDDNPYQPRLRMSDASLSQLVQSLNENGQLQAARVRPHPTKSGRFQLVFGHRRREAVRRGANAGSRETDPIQFLGQLRCEIVTVSEEQMLEAAYAENEDREAFSVFDRAHYFQTLRRLTTQLSPGTIEPLQTELHPRAREISWEELARTRALPLSPRAIRRLVQVLELPETVQNRLAAANLGSEERPEASNEKHCRALLLLQSQSEAQNQLLDAIINAKLSGNEALRRAEIAAKTASENSVKSQAPRATPARNANKKTSNRAHSRQNNWQNWLQKQLRPTLSRLERMAEKTQNTTAKDTQIQRQQLEIAAKLEALAAQIRAQIQD